ncbi:hypothetical protein BpHYR1_017786 [Brachionus plicatilis]|uniref:Uncharacterized protein n=1 Tax=Brachionus plicatilis TaxID=10195 RepID=A0A3M7QVB1_BRAPC|nr:hypothetical protein BpHYR1_017786 [Brachionus plicatilis]
MSFNYHNRLKIDDFARNFVMHCNRLLLKLKKINIGFLVQNFPLSEFKNLVIKKRISQFKLKIKKDR